jgi:hypothetical protein
MPIRRVTSLLRCASAVGLVLVLAACTPGGQFDPTVLLANDTFDSKTKLKGEREPVFPTGVPGTETGVPPDLVKGYQAPPDQTADTAPAPDAAPQAAAQAKPKPKPKPKVARAPAATPVAAPAQQGSAFNQPAGQPPTRISVGSKPGAPTSQGGGSPQPAWPGAQEFPPQQAAAPAAQSQSVWPAPPPTAPQQQPSQSVWPNPPAPAASSQ